MIKYSVVAMAIVLVVPGCNLSSSNYYQPDFAPRVKILTPGGGTEYGPELLPLSPANSWLYQVDIPISAGGEVRGLEYRRMRGVEQRQIYRDTAWIVKMQTQTTAWDSYIKVDDTGIWYYGTQLETHPSPIPWVLFPARVGMRWEVKIKDSDDVIEGAIEAMEVVACPVGVFNALRIAVGQDRLWLVPHLGIVKRISSHTLDQGWYMLRSFEVPGFSAAAGLEVQP